MARGKTRRRIGAVPPFSVDRRRRAGKVRNPLQSPLMRTLFLAVMVVFAATAAPAADWYEQYEKGVRLIEQGNAMEAKTALEAAVAGRSAEGVQLPTRPQQYIDYLPHLYLAIANQMSGD